MDYSSFLKLGFNKNEAKVYLCLLQYGESDAKQLIKETGFHKNIVYDNLNKLIEKGIVSYIQEETRRIFVAQPFDAVLELLNKKQKKLDQEYALAEKLTKEINQIVKKSPVEQEATMFRGISGIKQVFKEIFKEKKEYIGFGGSKESVEIMGEAYWHNFHAKQTDLGFKGKLLFNYSLRKWGKKMGKVPIEVKYTKRQFESLTETMVWGDTAAIFVWSEKPIALVIKDKHVADSYKQFFEILWRQGEK